MTGRALRPYQQRAVDLVRQSLRTGYRRPVLQLPTGAGKTHFVGLTATPWAKGMGKSYDDLIIPVSISQLITDGYLSPFRVFAPPDLT